MFSKKTRERLRRIGSSIKRGAKIASREIGKTSRELNRIGGKVNRFTAPVAEQAYQGFQIPRYRRRNLNRMIA